MKNPHTLHTSKAIAKARTDWKLHDSNFCYTCGRSFNEVKAFAIDCEPCFNEQRLRSNLAQSAKGRGVKAYWNVVANRPYQPLG